MRAGMECREGTLGVCNDLEQVWLNIVVVHNGRPRDGFSLGNEPGIGMLLASVAGHQQNIRSA